MTGFATSELLNRTFENLTLDLDLKWRQAQQPSLEEAFSVAHKTYEIAREASIFRDIAISGKIFDIYVSEISAIGWKRNILILEKENDKGIPLCKLLKVDSLNSVIDERWISQILPKVIDNLLETGLKDINAMPQIVFSGDACFYNASASDLTLARKVLLKEALLLAFSDKFDNLNFDIPKLEGNKSEVRCQPNNINNERLPKESNNEWHLYDPEISASAKLCSVSLGIPIETISDLLRLSFGVEKDQEIPVSHLTGLISFLSLFPQEVRSRVWSDNSYKMSDIVESPYLMNEYKNLVAVYSDNPLQLNPSIVNSFKKLTGYTGSTSEDTNSYLQDEDSHKSIVSPYITTRIIESALKNSSCDDPLIYLKMTLRFRDIARELLKSGQKLSDINNVLFVGGGSISGSNQFQPWWPRLYNKLGINNVVNFDIGIPDSRDLHKHVKGDILREPLALNPEVRRFAPYDITILDSVLSDPSFLDALYQIPAYRDARYIQKDLIMKDFTRHLFNQMKALTRDGGIIFFMDFDDLKDIPYISTRRGNETLVTEPFFKI